MLSEIRVGGEGDKKRAHPSGGKGRGRIFLESSNELMRTPTATWAQ